MVLVFHQAALGDAVLLWPTLRKLAGSGEHVTLVTPWSHGMLATRVLGSDGVAIAAMDIEMFEFGRLFAKGGPTRMSPAVAELFEQATRVVSFVSSGDDAWAENIRRLTPTADLAFVRPRPAKDWDQHVTRWHVVQLGKQGLNLGDVGDRIPDASHPSGGSASASDVLIHPGSGGEAKCWPADRFEALVEQLQADGRTVRVVLGEAELERWDDAEVARWRETYDVVTPGLPTELADVIAAARLYVGNDAGPTHLAAQLGVPTLALFGPTSPGVWQPVGPSVEVLAPDEPIAMDWLSVDAAKTAVESLLA